MKKMRKFVFVLLGVLIRDERKRDQGEHAAIQEIRGGERGGIGTLQGDRH